MNSPNISKKSSFPSGALLLSVLVAIIAFAISRSLTRQSPTTNHPAVGMPAPELDLIQLIANPTLAAVSTSSLQQATDAEPAAVEGETRMTGQPQSGKVTVLHFWGTWCPPCKAEYPLLIESMKQREKNPLLQFVSVSCESGPGESFDGLRSATRKYYEKINAGNLATYVDANGITRRNVANAFGEASIVYPTTVIIDATQRIAGVWQGYTTTSLEEMETLMDDLLKRSG
jgi:thiol-disulfide isomerase/thioredoxin